MFTASTMCRADVNEIRPGTASYARLSDKSRSRPRSDALRARHRRCAHAMARSIAVEAVRRGFAIEGAELPSPRRGERAQIGARLDRVTHGGITGQHVDRESVGDVLVRRLLPP